MCREVAGAELTAKVTFAAMDSTQPDCTASYSRVFANRAEAEQTLAALTEKARSVESEPCKITPTFTEESDGVRLDIDFTFACEAEMLIFQLGLR